MNETNTLQPQSQRTAASKRLERETAIAAAATAERELKNLRTDTENLTTDVQNLRGMRHNILGTCFNALGLQGLSFVQKPMDQLSDLTDAHSQTIASEVNQLLSLRDNILSELFRLFPAHQPDFGTEPVNNLDKLTTQHVESMVYGLVVVRTEGGKKRCFHSVLTRRV